MFDVMMSAVVAGNLVAICMVILPLFALCVCFACYLSTAWEVCTICPTLAQGIYPRLSRIFRAFRA